MEIGEKWLSFPGMSFKALSYNTQKGSRRSVCPCATQPQYLEPIFLLDAYWFSLRLTAAEQAAE